uniref:Obscurin-like protein 1 n=1 Tax=Electrophorus electricus TaxID=8005 RepID=A0A4W4H4H2_ELEEL
CKTVSEMDVFGGAPRFLAYPRPVVVQSGTDAMLKCQIGGDPRPAVIWERNNEKIHPGGRYRVFEDGNIYNLIITVVSAEDSGQYICKAKNCIGETYAAATLKVEGEAQEMELREENKPRFLIKPLSTRVGRGEDAAFSCKLWGNPRPEVVWEKDGKKLNEIFESTHFSVGYQDGGWFQLKIFKTRAPDGGVYTCKARNEYGESLAGAVLLVDADDHLPNSTKVKMFAVTEGKHAKFRCYVTGKPKPEIIWRKDGRLILSGRRYLLYEDREGYFTLKVLYCKQQDNGVYVCSASNTAGQTLSAVHLSVKAPPVRFKQPLNDLQVWERDLAILECEVPEDSVPITWYLEDRRLQPGAKYGMEEWGTKRRLTIRDIGVDDDGIYLCEMADGGRSIAEVTVKGTIVRKLPRKVDVLEGENAAFCVEVEEEEMDIHWYKDGIELRETHQTILKSFGRTHILVFVNTTHQDSGMVTFYASRSRTSSQLRVKGARHCPPSCPIGVQINTERANAALLSWSPAQDFRRNPPSGYILERQEMCSQEWLQCLTTDSATSVEILGDSVPCEADYRFRICSVNKYGRSGYVEFPRAVHLVPVAKIQSPLQDALVPEGQDACFSIELSASVIGTWFLNGNQLQEDERFSMRRSRTHQSLRIRGVRDTDNGAEITFIAYGIRDSAALYIQAPLVKFTPLSEMDRNKFVEVGNPIVLYCELSNPEAQVRWYKNGVELHSSGLDIQSDGTKRVLVVEKAECFHSGVYCCKTKGSAIQFTVEVKDIMQYCFVKPVTVMIADPEAPVCWYKDGIQLESKNGLVIQSEDCIRRLVLFSPTAPISWHREGDEFVQKNLTITLPVKFSEVSEAQKNKCTVIGEPFELECEVSDAATLVCWYKDGKKLQSHAQALLLSEGTIRKLSVQSAELSDSGTYCCKTDNNAILFNMEVKAPPLRFKQLSEVEKNQSVEVGSPIVLKCEISDPAAQVCWYKNGTELSPKKELNIQSDGNLRKLILPSAKLSDTGHYMCGNQDDAISFKVDVQALPEVARNKFIETGCPIILQCEISDPAAQVFWLKDGVPLFQETGLDIQSEGTMRTMIIQSAELKHSGVYSCQARDDQIAFKVDVAAPPVMFTAVHETEKNKSLERMVLSCEISRPNASVCWYRDGLEVEENDNLILEVDGVYRRLIIPETTVNDSAEYVCDTTDDSVTFFVNIADPPLRFLQKNDIITDKHFVVSDAIVLKCELSRANGVIHWYKDNERIVVLSNLQVSDTGEYVCDAMDDKMTTMVTVQDPRTVEFIAELHNMTVMEGEDATFKCVVSPEDAKLVWHINGLPITSNERFNILSNGLCHMLHITNCQVSDSCKLTADAEGMISKAILQVQETQVLFTKSMESVAAEEFGEATFEAEVSLESGEVQWMKQGVVIHPGPKFALKENGRKRSLTIRKLTLSDQGTYTCETLHDRTQAKLTVERDLFLMASEACSSLDVVVESFVTSWMSRHCALKVILVSGPILGRFTTVPCFRHLWIMALTVVHWSPKALEMIQTFEHETASFEVELSHSNVEGVWHKDGSRLKNNNHWRMTAKGRVHSLTIWNLTLEDTGTYMFSADNARSSARLSVKERELEVLQSLEDLEIQEDQNAVFMCEVSLDNTAGEWFKNGEKIKPTSTIKIRQEGTKHFLLMCNVKGDDSGEIKFVTKNIETVAYLEVKKLPVNIVKPLQDKTALEKTRVILDCTVSNPRCSIRWYKGSTVILPSERFEICSEGCYRKLVIQQVALEDEGTYSVQVGDYTSSARLTVEGETNSHVGIFVTMLRQYCVPKLNNGCQYLEFKTHIFSMLSQTFNTDIKCHCPTSTLCQESTTCRH